MPPRPPLAQAARCELQYTVTDESGGHVPANIFYLSFGMAGVTAAELVTLATSIATNWNGNIAPLVHSDCALTQVTVTMIDGTETQGIWTGSHSGTNGTTSLMPPSVAACVSWQIARAYRGGHPRTYLPGMAQGNMVGTGWNLFTAAYATAVADDWDAFLLSVNTLTIAGGSVSMGTVSYRTGNAPRAVPVFFGYVQGGTRCNTRLASQRRRLGKLSVGAYES